LFSKRALYKLLLVISPSLYAISIFQPWLIEHYYSFARFRGASSSVIMYWSFQAVEDIFRYDELANSTTWRFHEYWFVSSEHYSGMLQGWLLIFIFQILTIASGVLSIVKLKVRDRPVPLFCTIFCSLFTLIICYLQWIRQLPPAGRMLPLIMGYLGKVSVNFTTGFFIALVSFTLWLVSLLIYKISEREYPI